MKPKLIDRQNRDKQARRTNPCQVPTSRPLQLTRVFFMVNKMRFTKKLYFGIATNDADYHVNPNVNGKQVMCPFFRKWRHMIYRCYSKKYHLTSPTYSECYVCDEWLTFSNFKRWMETQDWNGKHLDKDILVKGNKVYSPETCVFIDSVTNTFFGDCGSAAAGRLTGASWHSGAGKYRSQCCNPFTKKAEHLGFYDSEIGAHLQWKKRKHELACQLAEVQSDSRVSASLISRYV